MAALTKKGIITVFVLQLFIVFFAHSHNGHNVNSKIASIPRQMLNKLAYTYNAPEQIHLSFGNQTSNIVIMWSASSNEKSFVEYGKNPKTISRVLAQCTELAEHSKNAKKFIHRAELMNLSPGSHYTYRIISGASEAKSRAFSVNVPHSDPTKSLTFLVVADMGLLTKSLQFVVEEAMNNQYDAFFHVGDIAYNLDVQDGSFGDQFMNRIQKFTSVLPYMTVPGDHEQSFDFYHYRHRFSSPGVSWPMKENELWYSLDIGSVHVIGINTNSIENGSKFQVEQLNWLEIDLIKANENRRISPWIIVMGHRPLYCSKSVNKLDCAGEHSKMRDALEDLFFEYGVDIYISGHKHCYERSFPVYKSHAFQMNYINPKAPVYTIIGTTGFPYLFHEQKSQPKWLAASVTEKGKELFAKLTITNSSHLTWSAHVAMSNEKVDEVNIIQHRHGSFGAPGDRAIDILKHKVGTTNFVSGMFTNVNSFYSPTNRNLMLTIGVFSFSFLVFLLLKYSRVQFFGLR